MWEFIFFLEARKGPRAEKFGQPCRMVLNVFLCPLGQYHKKHNDLFFLYTFSNLTYTIILLFDEQRWPAVFWASLARLDSVFSFSINWCPPPPHRCGSNSSKLFLPILTLKTRVFYPLERIYFKLFAEETPIIYLHNTVGWSLQWRHSVFSVRQEVSFWQLLLRSAITRLRPCHPCSAACHLISETRNINTYFIRLCTPTKT
jgi:hypothetical protein